MAGPSPLRLSWLVARREISQRARDKSFAISTAISLLILAGVLFGPGLVREDNGAYRLGIVGDAELVAAVRHAGADTVDATPFNSKRAAEAAVERQAADAVLIQNAGTFLVVSRQQPAPEVLTTINTAVERHHLARTLRAVGVPGSALRAATDAPAVQVQLREVTGATGESSGTATVVTLLLYGQLVGYGMAVASGVLEEKTSRVVEILLSRVTPTQLLVGKVAGIGLLGLAQLLFIAAAGVFMAGASGGVDVAASLPAIGSALAWFLPGYALYACVFACAGAMAARQEELQNNMAPLTLVMAAALLGAMAAMRDPGTAFARVLAVLPPTAPLLQPMRAATGAASSWEAVIAVFLAVCAIAALMVVAGRTYRVAALRTRTRLSVRQLLSLLPEARRAKP